MVLVTEFVDIKLYVVDCDGCVEIHFCILITYWLPLGS